MGVRGYTGLKCFVATAQLFAVGANTSRADLTLRPSGEHGVRITLADKESEPKLNPALVEQSFSGNGVRLKTGESKSKIQVGQLVVRVTNDPLTVRVEDQMGRLIQELEFGEGGTISFALGNGPVLGL